MKKFFAFAFLFAAVSLVACGGNEKKDEAKADEAAAVATECCGECADCTEECCAEAACTEECCGEECCKEACGEECCGECTGEECCGECA